MNIGLFADPYGETAPSGLGRSVFEIAQALRAEDTKNSYTLYRGIKHFFLSGSRHLNRRLDLYIFLTPVIPLFFRPKKSLVVAYDFAYLDIKPATVKDWLMTRALFVVHRRAFRLATRIMAISEETAQGLQRHFSISREKIVVVPIGYIPVSEDKKVMSVPEKFFLFAGVLKERKNVTGIIHAFAEFAQSNAEFFLLIAGRTGGVYHASLVALAKELGIEGRVRFMGYVSNEELAYLYSKASALVFPSFIEGFGMPVLEAMSVGLPVITSDRGALAETAGQAALLVDPHTSTDIARAMRTLSENSSLRDELRKKGYVRAAQFSWQKTAQRMLEVIVTMVL